MWAARYGRRAARPNGEAKPRCSPTVRHDAPRRDFKSDGSTGTRPRKRRRGAASDQSPSKRTGIRSPVRRRWLPRARRQGDRGDASGRGQLGLLRGTRSSSDSLVHDWLRRSRHDADLDDGPSHRGALRELADRLHPEEPTGDALTPPAAPTWLAGPTQQLWCEPGKHEWTRPAVRGRKPTACPDHR